MPLESHPSGSDVERNDGGAQVLVIGHVTALCIRLSPCLIGFIRLTRLTLHKSGKTIAPIRNAAVGTMQPTTTISATEYLSNY